MTTTRLDVDLVSTKQFEKYAKHAGDKNAKELLQKPAAELEKIIVECEVYEAQVRAEKVANTKFQQAKDVIADFNGGERDTLAPYKAKKALAVAALRSLKDNP